MVAVDSESEIHGTLTFSKSGFRFLDAEGKEIKDIRIRSSIRSQRGVLEIGDESFAPVLTAKSGRREFGNEMMLFWHHDYQSHLNFRVEERFLFPAILVAYYSFCYIDE